MRPLRGYIPTLDGWRAIAVAGVIVAHAVRSFGCESDSTVACRLAGGGGHGVGLFFAISGLLISSRLFEEEEARGRVSLRDFYVRRAFRILPAALAYLFVVAVLFRLGTLPSQPLELLAAATFWRNYLPAASGAAGWYTGHFWSLAVEEHFYLLWPAFVFLCPRRWRIPFATAAAVLVGVWRFADGHFRWVQHATGMVHWQLFVRSDTRMDALLYACVLAMLLLDAKQRERIARWLHGWRMLIPIAIYATIILPFAHTSVRVLIESLLSPILIISTVANPGSVLSRLLELPAMRWLGRLSYSIYLWQQLFTAFDAHHDLGALQSEPLSLAAILACACASYYLVERPLIRVGHRLARPVTPGRASSDSVPTTPVAASAEA